MNSYSTSNGMRVSKSVIDRKVREAKKAVLDKMRKEYGYIFCTECGKNENAGVPIDCSHSVSVDECQKSGRAELAWDEENIKPRCRVCHNKHDKLYLD